VGPAFAAWATFRRYGSIVSLPQASGALVSFFLSPMEELLGVSAAGIPGLLNSQGLPSMRRAFFRG